MCSECVRLKKTCPACQKRILLGDIAWTLFCNDHGPIRREVLWDEMRPAYFANARSLLPLITAERRAASNETARQIRDSLLDERDGAEADYGFSEIASTFEQAADIAAAHIKGDDQHD